MRYTRISADAHVDLHWLPTDLFVKNASAALKERMPYVVDNGDGEPQWTTHKGTWLGVLGGFGPYGQKYVKGSNARIDIMAATGLYEQARAGVRRVSDPQLRLQDLDRDGVQAEVVYGLAGETLMRMDDHDAATEVCRIYNDWLVDFCRRSGGRLYGLASIHYFDVEASVREVRRIAEYRNVGIAGINLVVTRETRPLWHPTWEPMWKAISDVGLPLHVHCFRSLPLTLEEIDVVGQAKRAAFFTSVSGFQLSLAHPLAALIGSGVLERYPNLRLVLGESGIGWLPYALERMDHEYEGRFKDLSLTMKPSEYWRRQCKACFQFDRVGIKLIEELGVETLMWGSDYPHPDGTWPESSKFLAEQFGSLPDDAIHKITCENAGKFYGIIK